jgi:hypothetical protein
MMIVVVEMMMTTINIIIRMLISLPVLTENVYDWTTEDGINPKRSRIYTKYLLK